MATNRTTPDPDDLDPVLAEAIAGLQNREPARDLWTDIAPQLEPRGRHALVRLRWPTALAAGLALVAGGAGLATFLSRTTTSPATTMAAAETGLAAPITTGLPVVEVATQDAEAVLQASIDDLTAAVEAALPQLDPTTRDRIATSLAALDAAIAEATAQVRAAPDDLRAERYLTSTLRRKRDVLRTLATAAARS